MSGEVQHRKRKDKRKKKIDEGTSRQEDILLDQTEINGKNEEEHLLREDSEEKSQDSHDHHHGPTAGVGAKIIFFILFAGLLAAMGTIFFQIRGTEIRDTPIKESRYASILENFIEEYSGDEHDEHEEHDLPHADEHGDTDEHEADQEEGETHEPSLEPDTKPVPDVVLEPSMPETIEIPEPSTEDEIDEEKEGDEEVVEENEIIEETNEDETEQLPEKSEENVQEEDLLRSDEIEQDASLEAENIEKLEEYPTEEIPQLADQEITPLTSDEESQQSNEDHVESEETQSTETTEQNVEEKEKSYFDTLFEGMFRHLDSEDEKSDETHDESNENVDNKTEETEEQAEEETEEHEEEATEEHNEEETVEHNEEETEDDNEEHSGEESEEHDPIISNVDNLNSVEENINYDDEGIADDNIDDNILEDVTPNFDENVESQIEEPYLKSHYADFGYDEDSKEVTKEEVSNEDDEIDEIDEETRKEYIKIIDDVLREQQHLQQQHQNQQKIDDRSSYPQSAITNDYDFEIRKEIDEADELIDKAPDRAVTQFQSILELHPKSPRAVFGKALAMSRLSDVHKSNQILEQSIYTYKDVLDLPDVPDELFRLAGLKCVDRMRFRGFHIKSLKVLDRLIHRFPTDYSFSNQKAVTYLLMGRNKDAKESLEEALKLNPADGFAKCHYGFILKIEENNNKLAIKYLREGIATQEPGTIDGRFYFHLGDALMRENQSTEAYKVYQQGTQKGLFLSVYQRSLYNVRNLKAIPWWTHEQSTYQPYIKMLEKNWKKIRAEAVPLLNDENQGFFPENEGLRNKGIWKQFEMFARGRKITQNCERTPFTCQLIENIPEAKDCKRGQVKFSLLMPGTKVWPHTGPTNCRLRSHLGLVVPEGTAIRVANETRKWKEGKVMIFDDSFEHEVWHEGTSYRLILIVDFWHPDLTEAQKQTLTPI